MISIEWLLLVFTVQKKKMFANIATFGRITKNFALSGEANKQSYIYLDHIQRR